MTKNLANNLTYTSFHAEDYLVEWLSSVQFVVILVVGLVLHLGKVVRTWRRTTVHSKAPVKIKESKQVNRLQMGFEKTWSVKGSQDKTTTKKENPSFQNLYTPHRSPDSSTDPSYGLRSPNGSLKITGDRHIRDQSLEGLPRHFPETFNKTNWDVAISTQGRFPGYTPRETCLSPKSHHQSRV